MSRMSDLALTVEEILEDGYSEITIADKLEIPIEWVENVREILIQYNYED